MNYKDFAEKLENCIIHNQLLTDKRNLLAQHNINLTSML